VSNNTQVKMKSWTRQNTAHHKPQTHILTLSSTSLLLAQASPQKLLPEIFRSVCNTYTSQMLIPLFNQQHK